MAVGDAGFQTKCFDKLREIKARGTTIILVSHDTSSIEKICSRCIWINKGKVVLEDKASHVVDSYLNFVNDKRIITLKKEEKRKKQSVPVVAKKEEEKKENAIPPITQNSKKADPELDITQNHFGLQHIIITKAEMINEKNQCTTIFHSGEDIKIKIYYKITKPLNEYVFGVGIYNLDGINLYGNNTQLDRIKIPHTKECGCVTYNLKQLPLLSGKYVLNVAVVDENGTPMDFYRNYCTFDVVSDDRSIGYFSITHCWEVD